MTANDWTAICDKPHDIRLIVADMDGTLLDGDSNIPDDFWPLLDELHAKGVEFVPASGRQLATLRSMFADRVDGAMSYIAENGNVVVADDNVIDVHGVSWGITRTLIDLVDAAVASGSHDIGLVVCGLNTAYIQRQDRPFVEECSKYYKALRIVDDLHEVLETEGETVLKLAIFDFGDAQGMAADLLGDVERTHQVVGIRSALGRYHESRNRQAAGCRRAAAASRRHVRADGGVRRLSQRFADARRRRMVVRHGQRASGSETRGAVHRAGQHRARRAAGGPPAGLSPRASDVIRQGARIVHDA